MEVAARVGENQNVDTEQSACGEQRASQTSEDVLSLSRQGREEQSTSEQQEQDDPVHVLMDHPVSLHAAALVQDDAMDEDEHAGECGGDEHATKDMDGDGF